ncbi:MAG TPA: hypothetical protein VFL86_09745 [Burkholderiaceae bacterium]|nr:hypothetical protein [Burkholderiaceae bacterium]
MVAQRRQLREGFGRGVEGVGSREGEDGQAVEVIDMGWGRMQGAGGTVQLTDGGKTQDLTPVHLTPVHTSNLTGIPNQLKPGIKALPGMDMSDMRGHRPSEKPMQLVGGGKRQDLVSSRVSHRPMQASFGPAVQAACLMPRALVARAGSVLQAAWATEQGTLARLNLVELKGQLSPGGKQLYLDNKTDLQYEWVSGTTNDDRVVKAYAASHSSSKPLQSEYVNWDSTKTTSEEMDTPFGKASARHSRGAPFAQTNKTDYGGNGVGDAYTDMFYALRDGSHDTSDDAGLATALLELDKTKLDTDLQKNAAAKLTVAVHLAEEWRKQGALKIWRALLRLVEGGKINLDRAGQLFAFVRSADAGRQQVARFQDVYEEDMSESELTKDERMIYGAMSPINQDDFSSDDEMRTKKELKTKSRLYATKHQQEDDSD